ncbi:MAG: alkaline phosphatase D family protein [Parvularcula sp.]|jgi:phosphodiesterase/alkaline phosphatase D-like protein|nr:alkaline phosphatase D family protein [Parvularcula sp.]
MRFTRRSALFAGATGLSACAVRPDLGRYDFDGAVGEGTFSCGVASGDPLATSVVLWTRIGGVDGGTVPVLAEVAEDENFARIVFSELAETDGFKEHTVKVLAQNLAPGVRYYYRFSVFDQVSRVGRTKTLPEETEEVRFAIASCSNYPFGYFNAYDHIARQEGLDAVLHLGDYIYEYGPEGYGGDVGAALGRPHDPPRELLVLDDYRRRHRQYKMDPASRAMHAAHPLIAVWDDHETSNDAWQNGAENHQPASEGDWAARSRAAMQAYFEYMPVREAKSEEKRKSYYRSYSWGNFLTVTAIETRLTARTEQISYVEAVETFESEADIARFRNEVLADPARELLGPDQQAFVGQSLRDAAERDVTWKLLANQILMARVLAPDLNAYVPPEFVDEIEPSFPEVRAFLKWSALGLPYNTDAWDGYPAARERFYAEAQGAGVRDLLVLTGDTHMFWANDLKRDDGTQMGVELGTSGITSPGPGAYFGDKAFDYSLLLRRDNQDVRYADAVHNGYVLLTLSEDKGQATFVSVNTILSPSYRAVANARFDIERKNGSLAFRRAEGLGFKERVLFGSSARS